MSALQVPAWEVSCDEPGCVARSDDGCFVSGEQFYTAAQAEAQALGWDTDDSGVDFCPRHAQPRCVSCNTRGPGLRLDDEGLLFCHPCGVRADRWPTAPSTPTTTTTTITTNTTGGPRG